MFHQRRQLRGSMSDRKRGARETKSSSPSLAVVGAAPSGGAAMSSAKKARQSAPPATSSAAAESNGHPSAIIAPRCTYASSKGAEECPHIMVRGSAPRCLAVVAAAWLLESKRQPRAVGYIFFLIRDARETCRRQSSGEERRTGFLFLFALP